MKVVFFFPRGPRLPNNFSPLPLTPPPSKMATLEAKLASLLTIDVGNPGNSGGNASGIVMAEYVFLGGTGGDLRNKSRTLLGVKSALTDARVLPVWSFDGLATGQVRRCGREGAGARGFLPLQRVSLVSVGEHLSLF